MDDRRVSWPSLTVLLFVSLGLLLFDSAPEGASAASAQLRLLGRLTAVWTAFLVLFLAQGYISSWTAWIGILCVTVPTPGNLDQAVGLTHDVLLLAAVTIAIVAWSVLNERDFAPKFWALITGASITVLAVTWLFAGGAAGVDAPEYARTRQAIVGLTAGFGLLGLLTRLTLPRSNRKTLLAALMFSLGAPVIAFGIARLARPVAPTDLLEGGRWDTFPGQLMDWVSRVPTVAESWSWWIPSVVLSLMALAVLQRTWWGISEYRKKQMPLSGVLAVSSLIIAVVAFPATLGETGKAPLSLIWLGMVLSMSAITETLAWMIFRPLVRRPVIEGEEG